MAYTVAERKKFFEQVKEYATASTYDEKAQALSKVIQNLSMTTAGKEELAQLITENLEAEMKAYDIRPLLFDTKPRAWNEKVEYKRKGKFRAFHITRGGYVPKSQIFQDVVMAMPEEFAVRPACHEDQLKTGRIGSVEELRSGAIEALVTLYCKYFYKTLETVVNVTDLPNNVFKVSGALDKATLDKALAAAAKHGTVSIVGTYQSLLPITDFQGYTDTQKDEIMRTGKLGVYRGANIVRLDEFYDEDGQDVIKQDTIFIIVRKAGHVDDFGETSNKAITDDEHDEFSIKIKKWWGFTILYPEYVFMIKTNGQ